MLLCSRVLLSERTGACLLQARSCSLLLIQEAVFAALWVLAHCLPMPELTPQYCSCRWMMQEF